MRNLYSFRTSNPIQIEIFKHLFSAIAEEMGVILRKASFSPNIKERHDFSCALFNSEGDMVAQAAHIPVHLGSMPLSVASAINKFGSSADHLNPGDTIILNDPYLGGTHLPDITLVTPVFIDTFTSNVSKSIRKKNQINKPFAFVASRAHHADIGGISPGSMPIAKDIFQEGLIIPPIKFVKEGIINQDVLDLILSNVRTPEERSGDLYAQIGANQRGVKLLNHLIERYSEDLITYYMKELMSYSERMTRKLLSEIPDGIYTFEDYLDDNGITYQPILIKVKITIDGENAIVDFSGSAQQQESSVNAVYAITLSAVYYVFRSLIGLDIPNNSGCLAPITLIAPEGTIVNATKPSPVAGGNVETSQRIVDVLFGALSPAYPDIIPAASQGTMNNISIGGWDPKRGNYYTYYETIAGGTGASSTQDGVSAVHSHMTNTLNTPIEALEYAFPIQIIRYEIRKESGGSGMHRGGDGIVREIRFLSDADVTILSDRRVNQPYSLYGGLPGLNGINVLIHNSEEIILPGKGTFHVIKGDILRISTPGGGGFGSHGR